MNTDEILNRKHHGLTKDIFAFIRANPCASVTNDVFSGI
jgi:hypothetical protein